MRKPLTLHSGIELVRFRLTSRFIQHSVSSRQLAAVLTALAAGCVFVYAGITSDRPLLLGSVAVLTTVAAISVRWRGLLGMVLGLVLVETLLRRYVLNVSYLYFIKDGLLAGAYLKFGRERLRQGKPLLPKTTLTWPLAAFAVLCVLEVANPSLPSPYIGLLGLHSWLAYVPILWLAACAFPDAASALSALRTFAIFSIPIAVLGVLQQHFPTLNESYDSSLTYYNVDGKRVAARSIGTFASTGAYGDYLVIVVVMAYALALGVRRRSDLAVVLALFVGLVLGIGGAGARSASGAVLVAIAAIILAYRRIDRHMTLALGLTAALVASTVILVPVLPGLDRAGYTGLSPSSLIDRLRRHFEAPVRSAIDSPTTTAATTTAAPAKVTTPSTTAATTSATPTTAVATTTTTSAAATATTATPPATTTEPTTTGAPPSQSTGGSSQAPAPTPPTPPTSHSGRSLSRLLFGRGIGLGQGGLRYLDRLLSPAQRTELARAAGPEGGWADIFWEFGLAGIGVIVWLFAALALAAWRAFRRATDSTARAIACAALLAVSTTGILLVLTSKLSHSGFSILFWFSTGLAFVVSGSNATVEPDDS